jgi:peptidoglycan/LPS O-acetylase OafA/YrhL
MLLLGDASYSIYLVHYPIVSAACKALAWAGLDAGDTLLAFTIAVLAATAAGVGLHLVVEKPLLQRLGRGFRSCPRAGATDTQGTQGKPELEMPRP